MQVAGWSKEPLITGSQQFLVPCAPCAAPADSSLDADADGDAAADMEVGVTFRGAAAAAAAGAKTWPHKLIITLEAATAAGERQCLHLGQNVAIPAH